MAGIISERDIARGVSGRGAEVLGDPVSALMTREVRPCAPDSLIDQLMEQMLAGRIHHLPVVVQGALVGIVSAGDVVAQGHAAVPAVRDTLHRYIREASVRSIDCDRAGPLAGRPDRELARTLASGPPFREPPARQDGG